MTEYKRVLVTAKDLPQMRLADEFMSPDGNGMLGVEGDTVTLIADPDAVHEFINETGEAEEWADYIDDIDVESLGDTSDLPGDIRNIVEGVTPRVWEFCEDLIPDGADLAEYWWDSQGAMSFTCTESTIDVKNAYPATVEQVETWIADDDFAFNRDRANPVQNSTYDGAALDWASELADTHPAAEMRFIGDMTGPNKWEPHGNAFFDGLAVTMRDGSAITDEVLTWVQNHFSAEYNEHADGYIPYDEDALIVRADEFDVVERDGREWIRMWWD